MCGILGYVAPNNLSDEYLDSLKLGIKTLSHRGPDNTGWWVSDDNVVGMAHSRLSIIDLSSRSNQPMIEETVGLIISFNGEIYNYLELRSELTSIGYTFSTDSDTEIILKGYLHWGTDFFKMLQGMFAISIFNPTTNEIILARDNSGQKPLFYFVDKNKKIFLFASELKALFNFQGFEKQISPIGLSQLFTNGFSEGSLSIYEKVNKLEAGNFLKFNIRTHELSLEQFWSVEKLISKKERSFLSENETLLQFEDLLLDSINMQLRSDVPIGLLLSGGVDSSLIVALASQVSNNLNTYTVRFPGHNKFDESTHARLISNHFSTNHSEVEASSIDPSIFDELAYFYDDPIFDTSIIPTFLLSKEISKYCKVAIGGDGGDELFGGYPHYNKLLRMEESKYQVPYFFRNNLSNIAQSVLPIGFRGKKTLEFFGTNLSHEYPNIGEFFSMRDQAKVFNLNFLKSLNADNTKILNPGIFDNIVDSATYHDFRRFLREDILVKVDRASMANGLEIRSPFLDQKIIDFAFTRVSPDLKVTSTNRKILLKKLAKRHLPKTFDFHRKQGFSIPLSYLINTKRWQEYFKSIIEGSDPKIFNHDYAYSLLSKQSVLYNNAERTAGLIFFMAWVKKFNPSFGLCN
jgi:asparagine synthase (glutamine-hydrolysing)